MRSVHAVSWGRISTPVGIGASNNAPIFRARISQR